MKLGIIGGTFDPVHLGHLLIAEEARLQVGLERVLFVPAGVPWLKRDRCISAGHHRLAMLRQAIVSNPYFEASSVELERSGDTFTVDTLEELRRTQAPGTELYLILGMDALAQLPQWRDPGRLLELCTVVAVARPGYEADLAALEALNKRGSRKVIRLEGPQVSISSVEIRRRVARGLSIRYWVPEPVEEYIRQHGLYREAEQESAS